MKTNEPKLKTTKEPKFVTRGEAAEMLGVDRQTISNLVARKILHSGGHIVSKTGKNATTIIRTKELFDMLNKMGDLADVDQSLKNLELLKAELADKEREYKEHIESLEERIDYGNVNYVLDMFRLNFNELLNKMIDKHPGTSDLNREIFKEFAKGTRVETIARWYNITIARVWEGVRKVARSVSLIAEDYNSVVDERDSYKLLIEKQAEEIRALRAMVSKPGKEDTDPVIDEKMKDIIAMQNKLNMRVYDVEYLTVRAMNVLDMADIKTLGDLVQTHKHELMKYRNMGKKTLCELEDVLHKYGLEFGMDIEPYGIKKFSVR